MRKTNSNLPPSHVHCQGCGHPHHKADLILICLHCVQSKFIPKGGWLTDAFIDRKTLEQWWNHTKKINIKAILKQIQEQQLQARVRQEWVKPEEEEDWKGEEALDNLEKDQ